MVGAKISRLLCSRHMEEVAHETIGRTGTYVAPTATTLLSILTR
jgi:hypothetical protein